MDLQEFIARNGVPKITFSLTPNGGQTQLLPYRSDRYYVSFFVNVPNCIIYPGSINDYPVASAGTIGVPSISFNADDHGSLPCLPWMAFNFNPINAIIVVAEGRIFDAPTGRSRQTLPDQNTRISDYLCCNKRSKSGTKQQPQTSFDNLLATSGGTLLSGFRNSSSIGSGIDNSGGNTTNNLDSLANWLNAATTNIRNR